MKKYIKLYALLAMALFVGSCEDELDFGRDNNKSTTPATIVSGGEIVFGASAAKKSTRTIYGNPFDSNSNDNDSKLDKIELQWLPDDCVQIASPESAGVANGVAEYKVTGVTNSTSDNHPSTATLERTGAAGLQWGNVDEGTPYDFYAVYPSVNQLKKSIPASVADTCGLTADGKLKGYLPNTQTVTLDTEKSEGNNYVFKPNMDYAYMVAKEAYKIPKLDADGNSEDKDADGNPIDASIDLNFSSIVTALKFTIKPGEIGLTNENEDEKISTIKVTDLTLYSESGAELCGAFKCDFSEDQPTFKTNNAYSGFSQVAMKLGEDGCTLSNKSGSITTTFFLLPIEKGYTRGDLMLRIHYYVGDVPQYMTARLGVDIPVSQMTYINNLTMKPLNTSVEGSAWFSALHPNIYVSQVSIPVASNVFAHEDYGFETKSIQQVQTYTALWDMGVRGFELVTRRAVTKSGKNYTVDNKGSLKTAHFVCDEVAHEVFDTTSDDYIDFGIAFETLLGKLKQNSNETLVLICTYQAISDGYDPNGYVQQLLNYFDELVTNNTVKMDDFVQLHANSTVEDIRGKICVIIRPGDDDRFEDIKDIENDVLYSKDIKLFSNNGKNTDWSKNVLLIQDWGTAFDVWDRRYEGVAREAQFDISYRNPVKKLAERPYVENLLWGVSSSSSTYTQPTDKNGNTNASNNNFNNFGVNLSKKAQFEYKHTLSDGGTAYVQEWARVVPSSMTGKIYTKKSASSHHMWVQWPESYSEKLAAIDSLFKKSVATKGTSNISSLYINSLSGYYITDTYMQGLYPFLNKYSFKHYYDGLFVDEWLTGTFSLSDMGKGGDHVALAYDLNKYVYGILSGTGKMQDGSSLAEGPWGLVMMEHIGNTAKGADDKSAALVNLIMMNNFRFPLAQKPVVGGASVQMVPLSDESVDINKNIMVTWE